MSCFRDTAVYCRLRTLSVVYSLSFVILLRFYRTSALLRRQGFRQVLRFRGCSKTAGGSYGKVLEVGDDRGPGYKRVG